MEQWTGDWNQRGFAVVPGILNPEQLTRLQAFELSGGDVLQANERKQLWVVDAFVRQVATGSAVGLHLDRIFNGDGYFLWGAQLVERQPGEVHPWHSDLETAEQGDACVSVWIPVAGVSESSTLRLIAGSHRYGSAVQAHFAWGHPARSDPQGSALLEHATRHDSGAEVSSADCRHGDGVFFHGGLWHGTFNRGNVPRRALLLQYARHGVPVRLVKDRTVYPPSLDEERLPAVLPLRGKHDPLTNYNLLHDGSSLAYPPAGIARRPPLENPEGRAWKRFPYFTTATPVSQVLICHASELMPGAMPHMPHRHTREEVLIVLDGEATIFSEDADRGVLRAIPATRGDFFYYPRGHAHTITNTGAGPLHYLMFRWRTRAAECTRALPFHYRHADYTSGTKRFSVDRDSSGLRHLHVHFTRLEPGEAFPSHIDRYDTGIVVLKGRLSMLQHELGPGGVFLARAGELHNTRNESREPCEYIVFEFHARTG